MKRMFFLCLITVFGWQIGAAQDTASSNRRTTTARVITSSERVRITAANAVAEEAQSNIVYDEDLTDDTDVTGGNRRAPSTVVPVVPSRRTKDDVQLFKTENGKKLVYSQEYNAFVPVRTREEALRVALDEFKPLDTPAGKKLKKRSPNKKGKKAVIATRVAEDRKTVKTSVEEEEEIVD